MMENVIKKWKMLFFVFCFIQLYSANLLAANSGIATLKEFSGEVMIKNAEKWTKPEKELRIYSGSKIVTKQGSASILFDDGATMNVDPFSSIRTIEQMGESTSESNKDVRLRNIRIMLGRTKYDEQHTKERETKVELPMAVAALRGTGGFFGANETGESQGQLYDGTMETSGTFNEQLPETLDLTQALNSPTWLASISSAAAPDDVVSNIKEIQSELKSFAKNADPDIAESVSQTLSTIDNVLLDIEKKVEQIKQLEQTNKNSNTSTQNTVKDVSDQVSAIYAAAIKESMSGSVLLVLATLKGDTEGIATATKLNEQNDKVLAIAEKAVQTIQNASDASNSENSKQKEAVIASVVQTALNTVKASESSIKSSSDALVLGAKGDTIGAAQAEKLSETSSNTLKTAEKALQTADKAIEAVVKATSDQDIANAQTIASSAEKTSEVVKDAIEVTTLATQAISEQNQEQAAILTKAADTASQSVTVVESAMEKVNDAFEKNDVESMKNASDILDNSVKDSKEKTETIIEEAKTAETKQDAIKQDTNEVKEDAEQENKFLDTNDNFNIKEEVINDDKPASPV
ncbi:MAG: FecR domain-containing protein [Desulfamplus sp.]|nr:FecR domain-containing protein [Desulfamplus sp.]